MAGERLRFCLISALFLLSGASALVYETAWLRQILLIVGSTTGAVSTVLAVFMLGLGLGARWVGGLADRSPSPLRLYALLELGVGLYGLALPFVFEALAPAYLAVVRGVSGQGVLQMLVRVIFAFVLLLPPTLLMGATFPVLVRLAEGRRFDRQLGMLYGANLWGAVAGCLATGFVLIRFLGVRGAILGAVNINLGLSLVALVWSRWERMVPRGDAKETAVPRPATALSTGTRRAVWGLVFASGFATMAFEVLWMRILSFPFQSTMYAFTVILATFLAGLALGSALCARLESWVPPLTLLAAVQLGAGLTTLLLLAVARRPEKLIVAMVGPMGMSGMSFVVAMAVCSAIAVLLPATLMGVVFPLSTKLLVRDLRQSGRDVGAAYLVNSLGSVTGSVATPFVLVPLLGLKTSVIAVCATQATLGLLLLKGCEVAAMRRRLAWVAASLAVLGASGLALRSLQGPLPFDDLSAEGKGAVVEAHHDDATATVAVVRYPDGYRSLRIDGFEATSDHFLGEYMPMMTHVPMLLHPDPKQVLVLCFGTGSTAGAGLLYPEARIDAVDINPSVFGFAPFFRKVNHAVVENPRTRLILDDGRNFLLTSRGRYDVITAEPMPPRFAGVVNFYTREYYELARDHLNEGGFLVQWLPVHLLTLPQSLRVLRTARDVFPEVSLWMHRGTGIIVCRRGGALSVDVGRVRARLGEPELGAELSRLEVGTVSSFLNLYVLGPEAVARLTSVVAPITDDRPTLEFDPPVHPWGPNEQSRSLEVFFIARKGVSPVLMNSGAEEMATLEAAYADSSFTLLGDLYAQHGLHEKALAEYRAGFERARRPEGRALFLFAQAKLAQVNGQREEARRLLEEGLALEPRTVWARELHRQLGGN